MIDLPPHLSFTLEHNAHRMDSAVEALNHVPLTAWIDLPQMLEAERTGSIWIATWYHPSGGTRIRAAADLDALLRCISP